MLDRAAASKSPPRARIAFRVGIVGHRPNRLPKDRETLDALQRTLRHVLETISTEISSFASARGADAVPLYLPEPPVLCAVSSLAEGTDRMFAEAAIELGYRLLCPMPFHSDEFENDFLPPNALEENSRDRFRALLRRASEGAGLTTYELDGQRSAYGEAYAMAGRLVLNQSDLLVVVWDRGESAGEGGTVETLHEAVRYNLPVLWVNALQPQEWSLLLAEEDIGRIARGGAAQPAGLGAASLEEQIKRIVIAELAPPKLRSDHAAAHYRVTQLSAEEYFAELKPRWNFWLVWKVFRDLLGSGRLRLPKIRVEDYENQVSREWPARSDANPIPARQRAPDGATHRALSAMEYWVNRQLRPHYAWADKLADWYADHYRSAYISIYMLSALGVLASLVGRSWWNVAFEAIFSASIVVMVVFGGKRHWHERWMEYRLLAELIRQIRTKIPLGGGRPLPKTSIHQSVYQNLTQSWMYWHMRAIARAIGIPEARVTPAYLLDCVAYMHELVRSQLDFHKVTLERSESIAEFLHLTSSNLFVISLLFVLIEATEYATAHFGVRIPHLPLVLSVLIFAGGIVFRTGPVFLFIAGFLALLVAALPVGPTHSDAGLFLALTSLPAFGAAFAGIANQGEFGRLAKRSIAMASAFEQFELLLKQLGDRITSEPPTISQFSDVVRLANQITQAMVDEVSDWRIVVAEQPMRLS